MVGMMYLNLFFSLDAAGNSFIGVLAHGDIDGQVLQDSIEKIGGAQMRRIDQIVGAFRVVHQPGTIVGSVVQHDVRKTQNLQSLTTHNQL